VSTFFKRVVGTGDPYTSVVVAAKTHLSSSHKPLIVLRQDDSVIVINPDRAEELSVAIMMAGAASIKARREPS
jgi:hypothetical protein